MMLNLSRSFQFRKEEKEYKVEYLFSKESPGAVVSNGVCLELNIFINNKGIKTCKLHKETATLYQSNELIEKMIEEEIENLEDL